MHDKTFPKLSRRHALQALLAASAGALHAGPATAALDGPIKLVVNFPPGGAIDIIARLLAQRLPDMLKQTVIVENVAGAGGLLGAAAVVRANPDGRTLLLSVDTTFTMSELLASKSQVALSRFIPLAMLGTGSTAIAVHSSLGVQTMEELVKLGRTKEIFFATGGNGSPGHFGALLLANETGIKVNPIHYKGNAPAVAALVAGEVQAGILSSSGLIPHVESKRVSILATTGSQRSPLLPKTPTAKELGYRALDMEFMFIAMAPAGLDPAIASQLSAAMLTVMHQPDTVQRLHAIDVLPQTGGPPDVSSRLMSARDRYGRIARAANMKSD